MPLYEFECRTCHHQFEALVRGESSLTCPKCQSADLERLLSMFGVSSESTRQANLAKGRKLAQREWKDKEVAEHEAAHHAHDDHHH